MANVRVTCPTCKAELEIGEEHLGKEVECGSCLQPFVAEDPSRRKGPYRMRRPREDDQDDDDNDRRKKKRRREDDYEDDYDYSPPGTTARGGGNGLAVTALVLGILAIPLSCCCGLCSLPVSIGAIVTGGIGMKNLNGRGMSIAGLVLGILAIVITIGGFFLGFGMNMANLNQAGRFK
jgi:predicted Zn finger-like uncharacterized protein